LLQFSLHEVRRELRAVNHGLDGNEVREALTILARSRIIISKVAPGAESTKRRGTNLLESTAFPVLAVRRQDGSGDANVDDTDQTYLEFNPLVAASIRRLEFRPVSYAWLMRLRSPVSRWLYNRLSVEYDQPDAATVTPVTLSAEQIIANSGMTPWSRQRDTLRVVTAAVDALVAEGILDTVEKFCTKTGKRVDGIEYTLTPSARFLDQARHAGHMQSVNANIMRSIAGDTRLNDFVVISGKDVADTRRHRVQQLAATKSLATPSLSFDADQPAP
jgi:hypothetical protein